MADLGFEPLLGVQERHLSARYGIKPPIPTAYPDVARHLPWAARALELNRYLLDGVNPDGTPCQYRCDSGTFPDIAEQQREMSKREVVTSVVEEAVSVRICQLFVDGNHRTSILSMYEKLADAGWLLDASAVDLYILISNRKRHDWSEVKSPMVNLIVRHLRPCNVIPYETRAMCAGYVKLIAEVNTLFEDSNAFLSSLECGMYAKRGKWRSFRRQSKKRHAQYVCLYGHPHIK